MRKLGFESPQAVIIRLSSRGLGYLYKAQMKCELQVRGREAEDTDLQHQREKSPRGFESYRACQILNKE